jgi:uncharacterized integral membrane protein
MKERLNMDNNRYYPTLPTIIFFIMVLIIFFIMQNMSNVNLILFDYFFVGICLSIIYYMGYVKRDNEEEGEGE